MSDFIERNLEPILEEWDEFAAQQLPAAEGMTKEALRDLAEEILLAVAHDMRTSQTEDERHDKSRGAAIDNGTNGVRETGQGHAKDRLRDGYTLAQLVAEYRALRASVIRRWRAELATTDDAAMDELTRFNEAMDESLTESIDFYHSRIEEARALLNGVLAHDMHSLLGATRSSLEVILHGDNVEEKYLRCALHGRNSTSRLSEMVDDLLDFTRTRLGTGIPIAVARDRMDRIVKAVVAEQEAYHPEIRLVYEVRGDLTGDWDSKRIQQMVRNLIDNAVKNAAKDSDVEVRLEALDGEIAIAVKNYGTVIPEDQQRLIFDPLRQAATQDEQSTRNEGLGLGLYIAEQIAKAHDGSIEVRSSEEEGTIFKVRLPRQGDKEKTTVQLT